MNEYTFSDLVPAGIYDDLQVDFTKIDELL